VLKRKVQLAFGSAIAMLLVVGAVSCGSILLAFAILVDDNRHLQIAFKKILTSSGYQVELASDGEEGLRLAHSARPDVILLDMLLPKLGGVEVLRALKADRATATIPVIALSGLPMSNEARVRRDGAISYLQKSNLEDLDVLLQAIDYALLLPRSDEFSAVKFLPNTPEHN